MKKSITILLIFSLLSNILTAQIKNKGIPFIINYPTDAYKAAGQNRSIVQDKRGILYFANLEGILEFDGQNWRKIPIPNKKAYALAINKKGRIFVGGKSVFGFLQADSIGKLNFISLLDKIKDKKISIIGKILVSENIVYFVSKGTIFKYHDDKIEVLHFKDLQQFFVIQNRIFLRIKNKGLVEYKNDHIIPLKNGKIFAKETITKILPYNKNLVIFPFNYKKGMYIINKREISKLKSVINKHFRDENVFSAIQLNKNQYALGFLSSGFVIINKYGKVIQLCNTTSGLQNDKVIDMFLDNRNNLWLALNNGISTAIISSPATKFGEKYNLNNKTYSCILYNEKIYIGTPTGIYFKKWPPIENHNDPKDVFRKIGEPTAAWSFDTINGQLLCANRNGIRVISEKKSSNIKMDDINVWKILRLNNQNNYFIAGTRKGLLLFKYKKNKYYRYKYYKRKKQAKIAKGKWIYLRSIKGFNENCRHIEIDTLNNIWFSDETKGVCKLILNKDLSNVTVNWLDEKSGIQGKDGNYIFKINNTIKLGTNKGLYTFKSNSNKFVDDDTINEIIGTNNPITILIEDPAENLWFKQKISKKNSDYYELGELIKQKSGGYYLNKAPFFKFRNKIISISILNEHEIAIGTDKGFIHYDTKIKKDYYKPYQALIRKVEFISNDSLIFDGTYTDSSGITIDKQNSSYNFTFPFKLNDIRFSFSSPFFDENDKVVFKYFLEGNDESWSDWKPKNFKEYSNLREGNYVFHVIAKNIYEVESIEATYSFTIEPPWYRTSWAIIGYFIAAILLVWGIVRLSVRRLRKQKEYLEKVVEERTTEIKMKNERLNQAMEEIAATNEILQKRNEEINAKNKNITASITYAKRIQEAMLPLREKINQSLQEDFILFKPRDIVSGDFYWFAEKKDKIILATVDCTGHGVPGAFMSMIGSEILTTIVNQGVSKPSEILNLKNKYVHKALKQEQTDNQDGMDMTVCTIDKKNKIVEFAGAKNPLLYIQNNELFHIKGDKQSIGGSKNKNEPFENYVISYAEHETKFYTFSDGYQDQFGGENDRKFMVKNLKELIFNIHKKSMKEQGKILDYTIETWMKNVEQTDDILVIGFTLNPNS